MSSGQVWGFNNYVDEWPSWGPKQVSLLVRRMELNKWEDSKHAKTSPAILQVTMGPAVCLLCDLGYSHLCISFLEIKKEEEMDPNVPSISTCICVMSGHVSQGKV